MFRTLDGVNGESPQADKGAPSTAIPFGWDIAAHNKE